MSKDRESCDRMQLVFMISLFLAIAFTASVVAVEPFQAFPVANLNRTFDISALSAVEDPVAVTHGLVFTWSRELWRTDGTPLGTRRLCGPDPDLCVHVRRRLPSPPGLLYFLDDRLRVRDTALWRTDGTAAGTFPVTSPELTRLEVLLFTSHVHEPSRRLFFSAEDLKAETRQELWVTDGTAVGTRLVLDITEAEPLDPFEIGSWPQFGASLGSRVIFAAFDGDRNWKPWASDSTAAGTFDLVDGFRGRSFGFATLGDQVLFFTSDRGVTTLWRTDGHPAGTEPVVRFSRSQGFLDSEGPIVGGRLLFFLGGQLWATDGTEEGTRPLTTLSIEELLLHEVVPAGKRAILQVLSLSGGRQVWGTDGTPEGTRLLVDPCPGTCDERPDDFHQVGDRIAFSLEDGLTGRELWISDGTPQGTGQLADLCPGPCSSRPKVVGNLGGFLWVSADGGNGRELWLVRLATGDAAPLTDFEPSNPFPGLPKGAVFNGDLIFSAVDPERGQALWRSDGTEAGTSPFLTLAEPADDDSFPGELVRRSREMFFLARTPEPGLWATDGNETRLVWAASDSVERLGRSVGVGGPQGPLLFTVEDRDGRVDLYRSDGTAEGTESLVAGIDRHIFSPFVAAGDRVFYLAEGNPRPWEGAGLWVSDGTIGGTRKILELPVLSFPPARLLGDTLFFVVDPLDPFEEMALWVSDGTPEGTRALLDRQERPVLQPSSLTVMGSSLVFSAVNPKRSPPETGVWVSDGTPGGTRPLSDPGSGLPVLPKRLTVVGSTLYFTAQDEDNPFRRLVWQSDGTPQGTRPFETSVGRLSGVNLRALGDRLLLWARAVSPSAGEARAGALWISDGSPEGTHRLAATRPDFSAVEVGESLIFIEDEPPVFFPVIPPPPDFPPRLWISDGSAEGTVPLALPLPEALPVRFVTVSGFPLLVTYNEERGEDLWVLDEHGEATHIGRFASVGRDFFQLGRRIFFRPTNRETGNELWAFDLPTGGPEARRLGGF